MIPLTSSSYSLDQGQLLEFPEPIAQIAVGSKYVVALSSTNQLYILPIPCLVVDTFMVRIQGPAFLIIK